MDTGLQPVLLNPYTVHIDRQTDIITQGRSNVLVIAAAERCYEASAHLVCACLSSHAARWGSNNQRRPIRDAGGDATAGLGSAAPSAAPAASDAGPASDMRLPQTDAAGESPVKKLKAEAAQVLLSRDPVKSHNLKRTGRTRPIRLGCRHILCNIDNLRRVPDCVVRRCL